MFQKEAHISRLVMSHLKAELSAQDEKELDAWLQASEENRGWFDHFCAQQNLKEELKLYDAIHSERIWNKTTKKIGEKPAAAKQSKLWARIVVAAAISILIVSAGIWFAKNQQKPIENTLSKNDVNPGKKGATLTLANGTKIRLEDAANGELAKEAGVIVSKTADGKLVYEINDPDRSPSDRHPELVSGSRPGNNLNTLSTANGETYKIKLPDGSLVWLNSASSLTYNASLIQNGKRNVKLTGEGYFEVAKDKAHPFIIETSSQQVEVLGTHFNINAYPDEPEAATTLLEGSVKVSTDHTTRTIVPGEQARSGKNQISIAKVDTESVTAWKDGDFYLDGIDFRVAMRKIARWYDVEVIYDATVPDNIRSGGWIARTQPLSGVLKSIEKSGIVHFRIEGRKIYVMK